MLASAAELGINRDASGLLELDGLALGDHLPNLHADWLIEIDNKSLTHRPDLWGHYGMAREVAAITGGSLRDPVNPSLLPRGAPVFSVEIADPALCPRYSALAFDRAHVAPSPLALQARLESLGLNPINNLVDVTNYILAELPQPMHAFDADKLRGTVIYVRPAKSNETLHALNGETYHLTPADLVIADAAGPVALAGVIGGMETAVSSSTNRIVLESANFQAVSVRLTSARHKLRTDASIRFEKSLDPETTLRGLARAVEILREISPGIVPVGGVTDVYRPQSPPAPLAISVDYLSRKLGTPVTETFVESVLGALGFGVDRTGAGLLTVSVPSWRATKDISVKDDLTEEVGRMFGYGEITPRPPLVASVVPPDSPMRPFLRRLRRGIVDQGFTEVYNYSFLNEADVKPFGFDIHTHLEVRNPIASELSHLRQSLLPGLLKNLVTNARNFREFRLFEIGYEIHGSGQNELPNEAPRLAAVLYNAVEDERDFFEMKRIAECLFPLAYASAAEPRAFEHPFRTGELFWNGSDLGRLFELHPALLASQGLTGRAVFLEIDLRAALKNALSRETKYTPLRRYPTSGFDLSVVAGNKIPVGELEAHLTSLANLDLASIEFIRQYEGSPLAPGQKSVTFHLEVGALDHTLTSEEATAIRDRIVTGMRDLKFEIRGLDA
jgi:phenylalanyl-tRNA synthetase beta chain